MEKKNNLPWPQTLLLMVGSLLLIWGSYRLGNYAIQEILQALARNNNLAYRIIVSASMIGLLALALLLFYGAYVLTASLFGWPIPFLDKITSSLDKEEVDASIEMGPRNIYLLLVASLGSFYMLFLQQSQAFNFYWVLVFPVFILLAEWKNSKQDLLYVLSILGVLCFLCSIKLAIQHDGTLLYGIPPITTASLISYLLVGIWVYLRVRHVPENKSLFEYRLILTFLLGTLCIFYFHSVLETINCRYDPMKSIVKYKAIVVEKCPPYGNYTLSLSYQKDDRFRGMLLPVSARLYHQVKEGDTITLQLHPGLFGWPWYHEHMGERIR